MDRPAPARLADGMESTAKILVLGGTGTTGRRIARRLRSAGHPVRTASRTGGDVRFDLDDPATWGPALDGAGALYVLEPDLRADVDRQARIPRLTAAAAAAGVRRVVLLSAYGIGDADDGHPLRIAERAVTGAGLDWTILRPGWFAQNFSETFWLRGVLDGTLYLPTGEGRTAFVDAEDIAEVAAAALAGAPGDRHSRRVYPLTGPRAIGFAEAADLIAGATGRAVRHADIEPEAFIARNVAAGVPEDVARRLTGLLTAIRDGDAAEVADGVRQALDRPARAFEDYVTRTAAEPAGPWS